MQKNLDHNYIHLAMWRESAREEHMHGLNHESKYLMISSLTWGIGVGWVTKCLCGPRFARSHAGDHKLIAWAWAHPWPFPLACCSPGRSISLRRVGRTATITARQASCTIGVNQFCRPHGVNPSGTRTKDATYCSTHSRKKSLQPSQIKIDSG